MIRINTMIYLHLSKNVFNQYVVDIKAKILTERINYKRHNQTKLRDDDYI